MEWIDPEQNATYNMSYVEWLIKSGGIYNDVTIGVENETELICYHGMTGEVTHNGKLVARGPLLGSYNRIGIGVSYLGYVFFTYHGLPI